MIIKCDQLRAQTKVASRDVKEVGDVAKDAAQEQIGQVRENPTECCEPGRDKVRDAVCDFEKYVREQPVKSVLIAAGVGLLFGSFWTRR